MRKPRMLMLLLVVAALALPVMAGTGCSDAVEPLFAVEAVDTPAGVAGSPVQPEVQEPLLLGGTCEQDCQQGYEQCLVTCSKSACLISCEDQRCYCLRGCGGSCNLQES